MVTRYLKQLLPGPVVVAVFFAGMVCVWLVVTLRVFYGVTLDARDAVVSSAMFMFAVGWGAEYLLKQEPPSRG